MSLWEPRNAAGNIELVRRSSGESAEKNTPATKIADLCHLQHPEEGFSMVFLSLQQTAHKPALLGVCLPALCQQHPGWTLPVSNSQPLESPVLMAEQCQPEKQVSVLLWGRNTEFSLNGPLFGKFGSPMVLIWPS